MTDRIQVHHMTKRFGDVTVLHDITFTCGDSSILGVTGRNGSGKSILFKCISGLLPAEEGEIIVNGQKLGVDTDIPSGIGVIIETPPFLPDFSAYDNLKILADIRHTIDSQRIRETLELFGLDWKSRKKVGKYSMGMRQRLGLAQAIMEMPDILLLDEPMNGLDESWVQETRRLLLQMKDDGATIILASHSKEDIALLCDRMIRLENGRLLQE